MFPRAKLLTESFLSPGGADREGQQGIDLSSGELLIQSDDRANSVSPR